MLPLTFLLGDPPAPVGEGNVNSFPPPKAGELGVIDGVLLGPLWNLTSRGWWREPDVHVSRDCCPQGLSMAGPLCSSPTAILVHAPAELLQDPFVSGCALPLPLLVCLSLPVQPSRVVVAESELLAGEWVLTILAPQRWKGQTWQQQSSRKVSCGAFWSPSCTMAFTVLTQHFQGSPATAASLYSRRN